MILPIQKPYQKAQNRDMEQVPTIEVKMNTKARRERLQRSVNYWALQPERTALVFRGSCQLCTCGIQPGQRFRGHAADMRAHALCFKEVTKMLLEASHA